MITGLSVWNSCGPVATGPIAKYHVKVGAHSEGCLCSPQPGSRLSSTPLPEGPIIPHSAPGCNRASVHGLWDGKYQSPNLAALKLSLTKCLQYIPAAPAELAAWPPRKHRVPDNLPTVTHRALEKKVREQALQV